MEDNLVEFELDSEMSRTKFTEDLLFPDKQDAMKTSTEHEDEIQRLTAIATELQRSERDLQENLLRLSYGLTLRLELIDQIIEKVEKLSRGDMDEA